MGQRPKELAPYQSPLHYWGAELRALRMTRGMSLADLAGHVHCDSSYLGKIERAERTILPALVQTCDDILNAGGALLRLHSLVDKIQGQPEGIWGQTHQDEPDPQQTPEGTTRASTTGANSPTGVSQTEVLTATAILPPTPDTGEEAVTIIPARSSDGRVIIVSVPRRVFLQGLGTTTIGLAAMPTAVTAPISTGRIASRPVAKDVHPIEHFQQMRRALVDNDHLFGPRRVISMVHEQLALIEQLRSSRRGADQRGLLRMQAQYAQFSGWLHLDTGEHHLAEYWIDRALGLSHTAGDQDLTTYILTCKAQLAGAMRLPADAIGAGEQALRLAPPHSRVAVAAAISVGHGYALNGDQAAMERSYDRARETFGAVDADPDCPCGTWWLDETRIALERAQSLATLEDYHSAAQSFQSSIPNVPSHFPRGRGVWLSRNSLALANDHEVEHAAALGLEALAVGMETGSGRILTPLVELNEALARWSTVPAVADFRTAMNDTILRQA